jgi:hypothetical protein
MLFFAEPRISPPDSPANIIIFSDQCSLLWKFFFIINFLAKINTFPEPRKNNTSFLQEKSRFAGVL